ncbi:MAG: hypothetical protein ABI743_00095 [bacterium]
MSRSPWILAFALGLSALGCQGGSPTAPIPAGLPDGHAAVGAAVGTGDAQLQALGLYEVTIDPTTLASTVTLLPNRHGAENDDVYLLPIDNFLKPQSFQVLSISKEPVGNTIDLHWRFTHPFRASGTIPRADLGFSGIACFLLDVSSTDSHTFFDDGTPIILNDNLITNADGYYEPKGLIDLTGYTANTFPFQTLVNDAGNGNRIDAATHAAVSNSGFSTGNFGPDSWQTGSSSTWTGYDILHQGQAADRTISIQAGHLALAGPQRFVVAILDKYVDPRSGTPGIFHRLPSSPADVVNGFAYREPHGCWDVSKITFRGDTNGFIQGKLSSSTISFHVRDWDARAIVTEKADLADDPNPVTVLATEVGTPTLDVCIPTVLGDPSTVVTMGNTPIDEDSLYGGDVDVDSGRAGDGLFYSKELTTTGAQLDFRAVRNGLLRVTDVQAANPAYQTPLDANLVPLTANLPENVTYQVFPVLVLQPSTGTGWANPLPGPDSQTGRAVTYDSAGNVIVVGSFDDTINLGGILHTAVGVTDAFAASFDNDGNFNWGRTWGSTLDDLALGVATDDSDNVYIVGDYSGTTIFDPIAPPADCAGGTDIYVLKVDNTGSYVTYSHWGSTGDDVLYDIDINPTGGIRASGAITGTVDFGSELLTATGPYDAVLLALNPLTGVAWGTALTSTAGSAAKSVTTFDNGDAAICGAFNGSIDFGSGPEASIGMSDLFVARYRHTGPTTTVLWHHTAGTAGGDIGIAVASETYRYCAMAAWIRGPVDFGAGPVNAVDGGFSSVLVDFDETGNQRWADLYGGGVVAAMALERNDVFGDMYVALRVLSQVEGPDFFLRREGAASSDIVIAHVPTYGGSYWARIIGGDMDDFPNGLAINGSESVAYTGEYSATTDFAPGPQTTLLTPEDINDGFVSQLPGDGEW